MLASQAGIPFSQRRGPRRKMQSHPLRPDRLIRRYAKGSICHTPVIYVATLLPAPQRAAAPAPGPSDSAS
jgi:hypothetical protein